MQNRKETGKYQVNIEILKSGDGTIAKELTTVYTKCITERSISKTLKDANTGMVIFVKKGNRKDIKNYIFAGYKIVSNCSRKSQLD